MNTQVAIQGNGIIAETGHYGVEIDTDALYQAIKSEADNPTARQRTLEQVQQTGLRKKLLGLPPSFDAHDLASVGWGVISPPDQVPQACKTALNELIEHRRQRHILFQSSALLRSDIKTCIFGVWRTQRGSGTLGRMF